MIKSDGIHLEMTYHQDRPIVHANHPFQGVCYARLPIDGHFTLAIYGKNPHGARHTRVIGKYIIGEKIKVEKRLEGMVINKIQENVGRGRIERVNRSVQFKICAHERLEKSLFSCSMNIKSRSFVSSRDLYLRYEPRKPIFTVYYHLPPSTLVYHHFFKMFCSAVVGTNGALVYEMSKSKNDKLYYWKISWNSSTYSELGDSKLYISIKIKKVKRKDGPAIFTEFTALVNGKMDGAKFRCFSVDDFGKEAYFGIVALKETTSEKLKIAGYGFAPLLRVKNMFDNNYFGNFEETFWVLGGSCLSFRSSFNLTLSFRYGVWKSIYVIDRMSAYRPKHASKKISTKSDTVISVSVHSGKNKYSLYAHFELYMKYEPVPTTVSCRVHTLQICKTYNLKDAIQRLEASEQILNEASSWDQIKIIPLAIIGMFGFLLFVLLVKTTVNKSKTCWICVS
ncbi:hypothetical protein RRG08_026326 [Elysia crispata]|uniref:Uncharacterized protein n=1 Tax=Elysia crispata TaxID=231223 RepID=A0AAE0ZAH4_9GAST|nr:hypothetical protein RRG08_026326 [Elysia crispata]